MEHKIVAEMLAKATKVTYLVMELYSGEGDAGIGPCGKLFKAHSDKLRLTRVAAAGVCGVQK